MQPAAPGDSPARRVCKAFLGKYKDIAARFKHEQKPEETVATQSLDHQTLKRRRTTNWQPISPQGVRPLAAYPVPYRQVAEIHSMLRMHHGEARTWQIGPEEWVPFPFEQDELDEAGMGFEYKGTRIDQTMAACSATFKLRKAGERSTNRDV